MPEQWLPNNKQAAICFSIDDVHPARSTDLYEAGGDLAEGALGQVQRLIGRHPKLRATLFTTADWREIRPTSAFPLLDRIPGVSRYSYRAQIRAKGEMALDRHAGFVDYLRSEPGFEVALHGLHHLHPKRISPVEFLEQSREECRAALVQAIAIFRRAGLPFTAGMTPPGWNAPPALLAAMVDVGLAFVASARDILTPVAADARANMSGLKGVALCRPERIHDGRLIHIPANFQATSPIDRAYQIIDAGGLLSIKGHIIKDCCGHIALDGIDPLYCNYLDTLLSALEARYGEALWWTSMGEIAERFGAEAPAEAECHSLNIEPAPAGEDARYLAALQDCFGRWGGQSEFNWYFRRASRGSVADRFIITDEGEWIAGSAISWRRLSDSDGQELNVGIMTGSWTLPASRGRGCFGAIIEHSRTLCVERGADWLLAFVTEDNPSRRQLERAGSQMIPTDYLWSPEGAEAPSDGDAAQAQLIEPKPELAETLWRRNTEQRSGRTRFIYEDSAAWSSQLVERPLPTELLRVDGLGEVVVERHPIFDRILVTVPLAPDGRLELARGAWARALSSGRRFFAFSSCREYADELTSACGLDGIAGFITLLPAASPAPPEGGPWSVESGDRV